MQQFTVPQFIDVEDKIIGPITSRQFIIMLAGAFIIAINYKLFDFSLFLVSSIIIFTSVIIFSFVKINGRPFHFFVLNLVQTFKRSNLRIWSNDFGKGGAAVEVDESVVEKEAPLGPEQTYYQPSRLEELSLIVDTRGGFKGKKQHEIIKT